MRGGACGAGWEGAVLALLRPRAPPGCAGSTSEMGSALRGCVSVLRPAAGVGWVLGGCRVLEVQ